MSPNKKPSVKRSGVYHIFQWYLQTVARLFNRLSKKMVVMTVLLLIEKVTLLLSMLLPLKIILILGSSNTSGNFPGLVGELDRGSLVVALCAATLLSYLVNVGVVKLYSMLTANSAHWLLQNNNKMAIYAEQKNMANQVIDDLMKGLSGVLFFVLAVAVISTVYTSLLWALAACLAATALVMLFLLKTSVTFRVRLEDRKLRGMVLQTIVTIGFFGSFVFILADFLMPINPPLLIYALLGLIFIRQALAALAIGLSRILVQYENRAKVEALFFETHVSERVLNRGDVSFFNLLNPTARREWIAEVLAEVALEKPDNLKISWLQTGVEGIEAFSVVAQYGGGASEKVFLLKLFSQRVGHQAENDELIYGLCSTLSILPEFVGSGRVASYQCQVFNWYVESRREIVDLLSLKNSVDMKLLAYTVPQAVCESYARTHPMLWQRLRPEMFSRLRNIADARSIALVDQVEAQLGVIRKKLRRMPKRLVFHRLSDSSYMIMDDGEPKLISWRYWSIEPVGFGWSVDRLDGDRINACLAMLQEQRQDMNAVTEHEFSLVAVVSELEKAYVRHDYNQAFRMLSLMMAYSSEKAA